jgi:hypothetical protein
MFINERKMVIEVSKKFYAAACKYGTQEYKDLQEVRRDYPNFKIVTITRKVSAQKDTYKGLTYTYMETYIKAHDESIMAEYEMLRGISQEAKDALAEPYSYNEMKNWFLKKFPAIADFHKTRENLLKTA